MMFITALKYISVHLHWSTFNLGRSFELHRQSVAFNSPNELSPRVEACAMKPRDQGGIVGSRLNAHGVKILKFADVTVAPH
ncbi:hypothetical protein FB451DRAFT_1309673, partial [Mycena latifolia]